MMNTKRCSGHKGHWECGGDYPDHMVPFDEFGRGVNTASGLHNQCRRCMSYRNVLMHATRPRHPVTGKTKNIWKKERAIKSGGVPGTAEWQSYLDRAEEQWNCDLQKYIDHAISSTMFPMRKEVTESAINDKAVDATPRHKSEFGQSTPMTKRETTVVEGEQVPEGWVYVVYNPEVPSILKIGKTFPDGIPSIMSSARRFGRAELADKFWFNEAYKAEQSIHSSLKKYNLRALGYSDCGMELFKCTLDDVKGAIGNEAAIL